MIRPCFAILIALSTGIASAQLAPPAGPVKPTMKTLDEVEPSIPIGPETTPGTVEAAFVISQAGNYHLTANITAPAGQYGILVIASEVNIDLRGFRVNSMTQSSGCIRASHPLGHVSIRNGSVWGHDDFPAIDLTTGSHGLVEDVRIFKGNPALVMGHYATARRVSVSHSRGHGIDVGTASLVESCTVHGKNADGSVGIQTGESCVVRDCSAGNFGFAGIAAGPGTRVIDSTARACTFAGMQGVHGSSFSGCTARDNAHGFFFMAGVRATDCTAVDNGANGFNVFEGCVLTDCIASDNAGHGFEAVGTFNRFTGNTALRNIGHGFHIAAGRNVLTHNTSGGHGQSGNVWVADPQENFYAGRFGLNALDNALKNFTAD